MARKVSSQVEGSHWGCVHRQVALYMQGDKMLTCRAEARADTPSCPRGAVGDAPRLPTTTGSSEMACVEAANSLFSSGVRKSDNFISMVSNSRLTGHRSHIGESDADPAQKSMGREVKMHAGRYKYSQHPCGNDCGEHSSVTSPPRRAHLLNILPLSSLVFSSFSRGVLAFVLEPAAASGG